MFLPRTLTSTTKHLTINKKVKGVLYETTRRYVLGRGQEEAHPAKEGEGADDKMYSVKRWVDYKRLRHEQKKLNKIFETVWKLAVEGDVSEETKKAGFYI